MENGRRIDITNENNTHNGSSIFNTGLHVNQAIDITNNNVTKQSKIATSKDWNVIGNDEFKEIVDFVFNNVADALKQTLGPYGSTTIIEQFGEMHVSKDGWQVLKKIYFDNTTYQNIMQLLYNIAAQVVIKVGDGSTSSILAANEMFKEFNETMSSYDCRPKDFIDKLNKVVGMICEIISKNATQITNANNYEEIHKLAMVSTNGDTVIADMIHKIYNETGNPSIEFSKAKGKETGLEIIEGYKANINYIDGIFAQNEEGICEINKPIVLLFDHKIEKDVHYKYIIEPAIAHALRQGRRLLVVAPYYDKHLLNFIANKINLEMKSTGTSTVVYTRVSLINNLLHLLYSDFAVMCGATVFSEATVRELIDSINRPEEYEGIEKIDIFSFLGECGRASIGDKTTLISGFYNRNEEIYTKHVNQAISKYNENRVTQENLSIVSMDLYDLKQRVSKLKGKMGHITVGGYSTLERNARFDLVDDAVKACESAFNNGYNLGGNLAIILAIKEIDRSNLDKIENMIIDSISDSFSNVFRRVLANKTSNLEFINNKLNTSLEVKRTYNLITDKYDENIINSCKTDIEILKAASSIVSLLISSNQYLSIKIAKK